MLMIIVGFDCCQKDYKQPTQRWSGINENNKNYNNANKNFIKQQIML